MRILITEKQFNKLIESQVLKEYLDSTFDWCVFQNLKTPIQRFNYCYRKLGNPIGEGSARAVFEIDDYSVLKISTEFDDVNNLNQNEEEYNAYIHLKDNPLLPRIYGHADDFSWLWTERVIPATNEDFEKILGVKYQSDGTTHKTDDRYTQYKPSETDRLPVGNEDNEDFQPTFEGFLEWFADYNADYLYAWEDYETDVYKSWLTHPWFQYLLELFEIQTPGEFILANFGIAIRNGKPTIVALDIGWAIDK